MNLVGEYSELNLRRCLAASDMLSSDVSAAFDPLFPSVMEKKNSAYFGKGRIAKLSKLFKKKYRTVNTSSAPYDGLYADDFTEGTVCFTNWGTLYDKLDVNITYIPPLYPQVFLFACSRVKDEDFVYRDEDGNVQIGTKKILPVALIFDHKIGGANDLVPFIKKLEEIFKNPEIIREW